MLRRSSPESGFTLVEALIAATLLAGAAALVAHLVTLGAVQAQNTRGSLIALVAAQSKLEYLHALAWTYAADGTRVSDLTELAVSPARALYEDTDGFVDYLEASGARLTPPVDARMPAYVRRWAIAALAPSDQDTLIVQVCVFRRQGANEANRAEACVATARTRKP